MFGLLVFFKTDTPFYLVSKGKNEVAKATISKIFKNDVDKRLEGVITEYDKIANQSGVTLKKLFSKNYRKVLVISILMSFIH